jgi:hypothetical protein
LRQPHLGKPSVNARGEFRVFEHTRALRKANERLASPGRKDLRRFERGSCLLRSEFPRGSPQ